MAKDKLITLIGSLNESEFDYVEQLIFNLNKEPQLSLFRTIRSNKITSSKQLKEQYSTKENGFSLTKAKKKLYPLIITSLEEHNDAHKTLFPKNESIIEYCNIVHRPGMYELKRNLLVESITVNEEAGNIGIAFDLFVHHHNLLFASEFSSSKYKEIVSSMRKLVREMDFMTELLEVLSIHYEVYLRNSVPPKDSNDYKLLLDLLSKDIFKSVEPISNAYSICYWFTIKSMLYFSLNQMENCCHCLKEGIRNLTSKKESGPIYWNGVISLYVNLSRYYLSTDKIEVLLELRKEYHQFLEENKKSMYKNTYIKGKIKLFVIEVGAYQKQNQWSKGVAVAKKELSKKMYKDFQFNTSPLNFNLAMMAFGLAEFDLALDYLNKALDNFKIKFPSKEYFILVRMMIMLCSVEKGNYKFAISQIDALRKYIVYHKIKDSYYKKFLQMSKRYIRYRASEKQQQIVLEFYKKFREKAPKNGSLEFQWVQSKVEKRTIKEICNAF